MDINKSIYMDGHRYTLKTESDPSSPDRDNMIAESTRSLREMLRTNPGWQSGTGFDTSNVFTTFNPDKFPGLFGATITNYHPVVTDPTNKEDWNNTGTSTSTFHPPRVKELSWEEGGTNRVNLRYVIANVDGAGTQNNYMFRWTNVDDMVKLALLATNTNSVTYEQYPGSVNNWIAKYNPDQQLQGTNQFQFVNDINRENVMMAFAPNFIYLKDNSSSGIATKDMSFTSSAPSSMSKDAMWEWLQTNEDGRIPVSDGVYVCVGMDIYLFQKEVNSQGTVKFWNGQYTGKEYDDEGNLIGDFPHSNSCCYALTLLCERVVNGNYYYYTIPFSDPRNNNGIFYVNISDWATSATDFPSLFPFNPSSRESGNKYSFNPYNAFENGMTLSDDPNSSLFTEGFSLFQQGSGLWTFSYDEPQSDTNVNPNTIDHARSWNQLVDKEIITFGWSGPGGSGVANSFFGFNQHIYSGKELMAMMACFLIPTVYNYSNSSLNTFTKEDSEKYSFIGVRNPDGSVSGDYIPYEWGVTEVEKDMIPDDFTPFDPSTPDTPPGPDDPSETDPDKVGKGPDWEGDTAGVRQATIQGIQLPGNMFTLYALPPEVMNDFGNKLWAGFGSESFMENMWTAVFNTATIDFSEVLKYFPVCRWYPFSYTSTFFNGMSVETGPNLYFGRGSGPLILSGYYRKMSSPLVYLGASHIDIPEATSWEDLEPYASAQIYVPFCGVYNIPVNDIVGTSIHVSAHLNMITGELLCLISRGANWNLLMSVQGQIGVDIPLATDNVGSKIAALATSIAVPALTAGAVGTVSAASRAGTIMGAANNPVLSAESQRALKTTGLAKNIAGSFMEAGKGALAGGAGVGGAMGMLSPNMTGGVSNVSSPSMKGILGLDGPNIPCIFIKRTNTVKSGLHSSTSGNPLKHSKRISQCSGWTVCNNPKISGITATAEELEQIRSILSSGFYA